MSKESGLVLENKEKMPMNNSKEKKMQARQQTVQTGDASGRGTVGGFKVPFPAKMQPYTKEEINAVVEVMAESG